MSPIEIYVRGDAGAVSDAAAWIRGLGRGFDRANDAAADAKRSSLASWEGPAGDRYRTMVAEVYRDTHTVEPTITRAAEIVEAYGTELTRFKNAMERIRGRAEAGDLDVSEYWINPPAEPANLSPEVIAYGDSPDNPYRADFLQWQEDKRKKELFEELRDDAHRQRELFERWIDTHLRPMVEHVGGEDLLGWRGEIGGAGRFGVKLAENVVKDGVGAVKGIPEIPKHLFRIGETGYVLLDGAIKSGATGDDKYIAEAAASQTTGRGVDAVLELGKKSPLRIGLGSLGKTVFDAGTGEVIDRIAEDPELPPKPPASSGNRPYEP